MSAQPSSTVLSIAAQSPLPAWEGKLELIKRTVANGATNDELDLFLYQARKAGLDPLARQIYFVKRKGRGTIQVGIDGLRLIADRTGLYAGNDDAVFESNDEGLPTRAAVTIYKWVNGVRCPFTATARWSEYYPGDEQGFQWRKMPHVMLGKCAEALALRKAFPQDLSGLYVHEEMAQADRTIDQSTGEVIEGQIVSEHSAFGYSPARWPTPQMFDAPITESQAKMIAGKSAERELTVDEISFLRSAILKAYGVPDSDTKGAASLLIDFLMNANDEAIDEALPEPEDEPPAPIAIDDWDPFADE